MIIVARNKHASAAYPNSPQVPVSWDIVEEANGYVTLYPLGRVARPDLFIHSRYVGTAGGKGLYFVGGPNNILRQIHEGSQYAWTVPELRADDGVAATAVKAGIRDERKRNLAGQRYGERHAVYGTVFGVDYSARAEARNELP